MQVDAVTVPLTHGYSCLISPEDSEWVLKRKWQIQVMKNGGTYARGGRGVLLHRLITKAEKGQIVDHINGDTLDNRRLNLRICTKQENAWNSNKRKRSAKAHSQFRGVTRSRGKWTAQISVRRKNQGVDRMSYAAFRNGRRNYTERPKRKSSAQIAWDLLSRGGPLKEMHLWDGYWQAERQDGLVDELEAMLPLYYLRHPADYDAAKHFDRICATGLPT